MQPQYLDRTLDIFQTCAYPGCGQDATEETEAMVDTNLQYFVASCGAHKGDMAQITTLLASGRKPETLGIRKRLAVDELFISPPGHNRKCRYTFWKQHRKSLSEPQAQSRAEVPCVTPKRDRKIHAVKGWRWPLNRDRWRTTEGVVVSLENLRLAELVSAIFGIRRANFKIVVPTLAWTKRLSLPEFAYVYPADEIGVGIQVAKQKLDDMYDEALQRNLLE